MIRNIFICDRCAKEQESGNQMWYVGAYIDSYSYGSKEISKPRDSQLWCRSCCVLTGFIFRAKPEAAADGAVSPIPEPSLESKLREIIREVISEEHPFS